MTPPITQAKKRPSRIFVGLGSNLGRRRLWLRRSLDAIDHLPRTRVMKRSGIYETNPVGASSNPFLNMVAKIETSLPPSGLLRSLLEIETYLGRDRRRPWPDRTIDLDIVLWQDRCIDLDELVVPHPRMHKRLFVLQPLAELAPEFVHPKLGRTILDLLAETLANEGTIEPTAVVSPVER